MAPGVDATFRQRSAAPGRPIGAGRRALALAGLVALAATGCLEYSPHQLPTDGSERDLNWKALQRLEAAPAAPLRFAVVGDVQTWFDEAEQAVRRLNALEDLAFVVQVGDFTDMGTLREYQLMNDVFRGLRVPYLVVLGNHDMLGSGAEIYDRMFGPRNLAFTVGRVRLVLLDTNSREYGFGGRVPDLGWLADQLAPDGSFDRAVVISHVPSDSSDFDPALRAPFEALLDEAGVPLSLHGHDHRHRTYQRGEVRFVVADAVGNRSFLLVTEDDPGELEVEVRRW